MIKRSVLGLDRVAAFVVGLVLVALGVAMVLWWGGWLASLWPQAPQELTLQTATDAFAAPWWPGAVLAAGIVLGLLGLWWLLAHRTHSGTGPVRLEGSGRSGGLLLDGSAAASAAADVLVDTPGVRGARGKLVRDRGRLVVVLTATVDATADLGRVVEGAEEVLTGLGTVMGRPDIAARVRLDVTRDSGRAEARVH